MFDMSVSAEAPELLESQNFGDYVRRFKSRGESYQKTFPEAETIRLLDFFAGAGGMSAGFMGTRQSGLEFKHLGAFDINATALETLAINTGAPVFVQDIRDMADDPARLAELVPGLIEPEDRSPLVFIGCPPCQGFSAHRKKDPRNDPRNDLIAQFVKLCLYYRPDAIVMENVPEMIKGKYQHYFETARQALSDAGYSIHGEVVDLARYGVPQRRKRAIVVATLDSKFKMPEAPLEFSEARTVREAISHLRPLAAGQADPEDPWHRAPRHTARILERIEKIPFDGGDLRDLTEEDQLACHLDMKKAAQSGFSDVYGRLRWDVPSITITAKSSTPSCGRFLHPEQHRNITVREAAILQGFPQNYVFAGSFVGQYRQIGEAVPPLFARFMAAAVLNYFRPVPEKVEIAQSRIRQAVIGQESSNRSTSGHKLVDLFCGAGGLSLGMHGAGFESVLACDLNAPAVESFKANVGPATLIDLSEDAAIELMREAVGDAPYVVAGGPPCQGFSQQRRGADDDPRNLLVLRHAEIALSLENRPRAIILENVAYLDSPRGRPTLAKYLAMLTANGYRAFRYDTNSANFGVAQMRLRLVIIAVAEEYVEHFHGLKPISGNRWLTIGECLSGVSTHPTSLNNHVQSKESPINVARMAYVDMGRGRTAIPAEFQLACHRDYDGHLDVFGRLDWFGYARTLTGGFDSASRGEYVHPFRNRSITAREAARIQGFPDDFIFLGTRSEVRKQIGNAVPPLLGYAIGDSLNGVMGA